MNQASIKVLKISFRCFYDFQSFLRGKQFEGYGYNKVGGEDNAPYNNREGKLLCCLSY